MAGIIIAMSATNDNYPISKLRLRVERAKRHFRELDADLKRYLEARPYEIVLSEEPAFRLYAWKVNERQPAPPEWEVIVGDVLHNLRAALDQLVCELVMANGKKVTTQTSFAISENSQKFAINRKSRALATRSSRFLTSSNPTTAETTRVTNCTCSTSTVSTDSSSEWRQYPTRSCIQIGGLRQHGIFLSITVETLCGNPLHTGLVLSASPLTVRFRQR
jgi:hypothetical protein